MAGTPGSILMSDVGSPTAAKAKLKEQSAADLMKAQRKAEASAGKGAGARRRGCGWCDVAAWTGLVVSLALVGFGLAILILALTFNTEDPKFEILKVDLKQLNFGTSGNLLFDFNNFKVKANGEADVKALVVNPNNHEVIVEALNVNLKLFNVDIANTSVPGFELSKKGNITLSIPFPIKNLPLIATGNKDNLITTSLRKGQVDVKLNIDSRGKVKIMGMTTPSYNLLIACNITVDPFGGDQLFQQKSRVDQEEKYTDITDDLEEPYKKQYMADAAGFDAYEMEQAKLQHHKQQKRSCCTWQNIAVTCGLLLSVLMTAVGIAMLVVACTYKPVPPVIQIEKIDIVRLNFNGTGTNSDLTTSLGGLGATIGDALGNPLGGALGNLGSDLGSLLADPTNFTLNMNALINVTANVLNPNKYDIEVKYLDLFISLFNISVSNVSLGEFRSPSNQNITMTLPLKIVNVPLVSLGKDSVIGNSLMAQKLKMKILGVAEGKAQVWAFSSPTYKVGVVCNATSLPIAILANPRNKMVFSAKMADESPLAKQASRRSDYSTDADADAAYDADVEAAADVDSVVQNQRAFHRDSDSNSTGISDDADFDLPDSDRDALASPSPAPKAAAEAAAAKAKAMDGDSELGGAGEDGGKGKEEGAGKGKGGGAGKGKRGRRCGKWEIICWVGIGAGVVMTGIGLTMLVFFLSLTQQEPVVTVEGVDIVRLSISIPAQSIKMPNLDPSMVTVPNLGGSVPSLGNVPNLDIPSLDLSNLDLKNPGSLGKSLQDRLSNFGKEVSNLGKNVSDIGKNVSQEVSKAGRNVSKEVSKDITRIGDQIQVAIQNNFEGLRVDLNAHVNVTANVYNPNSFDGIFNFMNMGIYLFGIHVSNISLPAFEVGKKQTKIATVPIVVKSFPLISTSSSAQVRSPIATALRERKIKMQTFINTQGRVRVWGISSPTYNVTVMCVMTVDPSADVMTKKECGAKPIKV
ncbi:unnamed protein product [Closterium sp. Yama58-4]|nr:unnamed protein product [Closterium sp. Yama58-4]